MKTIMIKNTTENINLLILNCSLYHLLFTITIYYTSKLIIFLFHYSSFLCINKKKNLVINENTFKTYNF